MEWYYIVLIVLGAVSLIFAVIGYFVFRIVFDRKFKYPRVQEGAIDPNLRPTGERLCAFNDAKKPAFRSLPFERMTIKSFDGLTLCADFVIGTDESVTVIMAHGYKSSPEGDWCAISDIYKKLGYNMLFLHMRAHGASEGRYIGYGHLDKYDVSAWCEKIAHEFPNTSIFLHGMSMGAASVMQASDLPLPEAVKGVIEDCGFTSVHDVTKHLIGSVFGVPYFPIGDLACAFAALIAHVPPKKSNSLISMAATKLPVLFFCGKEDAYVPYELTEKMYEAKKGDKEILLVEGTGHAACYMAATEKYTALVTDFIAKHK